MKESDPYMYGLDRYRKELKKLSLDDLWTHYNEFESNPVALQEIQSRKTICRCRPDLTTGWIAEEGKCICNNCGKEQEEETKIYYDWIKK